MYQDSVLWVASADGLPIKGIIILIAIALIITIIAAQKLAIARAHKQNRHADISIIYRIYVREHRRIFLIWLRDFILLLWSMGLFILYGTVFASAENSFDDATGIFILNGLLFITFLLLTIIHGVPNKIKSIKMRAHIRQLMQGVVTTDEYTAEWLQLQNAYKQHPERDSITGQYLEEKKKQAYCQRISFAVYLIPPVCLALLFFIHHTGCIPPACSWVFPIVAIISLVTSIYLSRIPLRRFKESGERINLLLQNCPSTDKT